MGDVVNFPRTGRTVQPVSAIEHAADLGTRDGIARIVLEETGCTEPRADFVALRVLQMIEGRA